MIFARLLMLIVLTGVAGCASMPANSGHSSFSGYAEAVFRHQNEVSSRLMMLNESDQLPDSEEFDRAQTAMDAACQLLNDYVERETGNEDCSWEFKAKVQSSIPECDVRVQRMDALLKKLDVRQ